MSFIQSLIKNGEAIGLDRIVLTVQPRKDGEANAVVHFAVDQKSSYTLDSKTTALRQALSAPICAEGTGAQIELLIADALNRLEGAAKLAVDRYREVSNADDVVAALVASTQPKPEEAESLSKQPDEPSGETDDTVVSTPCDTNSPLDF